MARIAGLEPKQANPLVKIIYGLAKRTVGKLTGSARLVEPLKITAHQPRLLFGLGQMELGMNAMASVSSKLKSLASLKAAMMIGCPY